MTRIIPIARAGWTKTSIAYGGPAFSLTPKAESSASSGERAPFSHFLRQLDLLLDIHSMQQPCVPLMMAGMVAKGRDLAAQVGIPSAVITDSGHTEGMRMRDYAAFRDPATALVTPS